MVDDVQRGGVGRQCSALPNPARSESAVLHDNAPGTETGSSDFQACV
jgi:hypothetical protein